MSDALGYRLRELRAGHAQSALARALGVSVALISSWENGNAVPPPARLDAYARLFATGQAGDRLRMPSSEDSTGDEQAAYRKLLTQLERLARSGLESPFQFPSGQAITIACSELPLRLRRNLTYSDPSHPDFVEAYKYADLDALLELLAHVGALNPASPVKIGVPGEITPDDRTAHLILLGGSDFNDLTQEILTYFRHVPVAQLPRANEDDPGAFSVRQGEQFLPFRPRLAEDSSGRTTLVEDVALFLRAPNPFNDDRTLTMCSGMYARGSYGVVRALTDPKIRERNSRYIDERFRDCESYSILCRVKVVAKGIITPNWTLDEFRLHEWSETAG